MTRKPSKRRSTEEVPGGLPRKKPCNSCPDLQSNVIKFGKLLKPNLPPIVASSTALLGLKNMSLMPLSTKSVHGTGSANGCLEDMILCSERSSAVNYVAKQIGGQFQRHFIGICDPKTGYMKVVETKRMEMSRSVQAQETLIDDTHTQSNQNALDSRSDLLLKFGNKKARKAVEARVINVISTKVGGASESGSTLDSMSKALLDVARVKVSTAATVESLMDVARAARPVPPYNSYAKSIQEVYKPEDLIGENLLSGIVVNDWIDAMEKGENVQFKFRFIAHRLKRITATGNIRMIRVLRYFHFLLQFFTLSRPGRQPGTRQIPPRAKLREELDPVTDVVVEGIRRKFSESGVMQKYHIDLLFTHCCALSLVLDGFKTNIADLEADFKLQRSEIIAYFREIGSNIKPVVDVTTKKTVYLATLELPLHFPRLIRRRKFLETKGT